MASALGWAVPGRTSDGGQAQDWIVAGGEGTPGPWEVGWTAPDQVRTREGPGAGLPWVLDG